jgi:ApbE superfamily uncharacterized protein (UPF0280 family)
VAIVGSRVQIARLPGGRLHLQDGPIDLIIEAHGDPAAVTAAYRNAAARMRTVLDELCCELPLLRLPNARKAEGSVARRMQDAVQPYAGTCFITAMAAVAGSVADEVLAAMAGAGLDRITVNNGGDIAIHLRLGQHIVAGLAARPDDPRLFGHMRIDAEQPTRGIATSGFGGRSDTFGIADAVTIGARCAAMADAAATIVANAVDLPGHPAILRGPSRRAQSDLGCLPVTLAVGALRDDEIETALDRGVQLAWDLLGRGSIDAAALHLRGVTRLVQPGRMFDIAAASALTAQAALTR